MKQTGPSIVGMIRENVQIGIGRHLYGILGAYGSLKHFEQKDLPQARHLDGSSFPIPVNLNQALLGRIGDEDLRSLVQNEARLPQTVQRRLNQEFDLLFLQNFVPPTPILSSWFLNQVLIFFS